MDRLRTIVTEVYKAINGMSPDFVQDLFVIKANVHDLMDNNKMKLYKFKTMTYGKHSIKYVAGILWNSINVDIKNTDNVNVFKRKVICTCYRYCHVCDIVYSLFSYFMGLRSTLWVICICMFVNANVLSAEWKTRYSHPYGDNECFGKPGDKKKINKKTNHMFVASL